MLLMLAAGPPSSAKTWQQVTDRAHSLTGDQHTAVTGETEATYRTRHEVRAAASALRLAWSNVGYLGGIISPMPNPITIAASVEIDGTITPLTFNGSATTVITGGGYALSDALPAEVDTGQIIHVRTWVSVGVGEMWGLSSYDVLDDSQGMGRTWGADLTPGGTVDSVGAINTGLSEDQRGVFPVAILGEVASTSPVIVAMGSSSASGWGDTYRPPKSNTGGFVVRAADIMGAPVIHAGNGGDAYYKRSPERNEAQYVPPVLASPDLYPVGNFGANDFGQTRPLIGFQREAIAFWQWLSDHGAKYWQITLTPYSSSTDSWATVEGQTPHAQDARRTGFNDWLRDGAPLSGAEPVAIGGAGVRVGEPGHPLGGWIEAADLVETARNSGVWAIDPILGSPTTDGQHFLGWVHARIAQAVADALTG